MLNAQNLCFPRILCCFRQFRHPHVTQGRDPEQGKPTHCIVLLYSVYWRATGSLRVPFLASALLRHFLLNNFMC